MDGKTLTYKEYLASDVWRCEDSPTSAHHWIEIQYANGHFHTGLFYCKYCRDARKFHTDFTQFNAKIKVM